MLVYRKLLPADSAPFLDHLLRLDAHDRRARFSGAVRPEAVAAYCRALPCHRTLLVGGFDRGTLRAALELHWPDPLRDRTAEIAVTVEGPWQDRGVGTELLRRALRLAANRGVRAVYMLCLADNRRMQRVAGKFGSRLERMESQIEARLRLPIPTPLSLAAEALDDAAGLVGACREQFAAAG